MPSGSHGGSGGGSHFGGGGGGGFHFGGGKSLGSSRRYSSPMRLYFFGRHYYITSERSGIIRTFLIAFLMTLFFAIAVSFSIPAANETIDKIQSDHDYYIDMIDNAISNSEYQHMGTITGVFRNDNCGKWYFTYTLKTIDNNDLEGYTYSVYSQDEIRKFVVDDDVLLATNSKTITLKTDSINMDYKNIPIENDGEYINAIKSKKTSIIITVVLFAISAALLVVTIMYIKKYMKQKIVGDADDENISSDSQNKQKTLRCKYCGSKVDPNSKKCDNCGAVITD